MRHYDLADRTRNRFVGQVDIVPSRGADVQRGAGVLKDDFSNSVYGLQDSTGRTFSLAADFQRPNGLGVGGSYNYERYAGLQRSHEGDSSTAQFNDPLRDWTADDRDGELLLDLRQPATHRHPAPRCASPTTSATPRGTTSTPFRRAARIPTPNQLPDVFNKLQQLHVDLRHRLSGRLAASFSYLYEPLSIYDFAFDPSVVNGIVQPSSLVMGYVYRPYTAHSAVFGILYHW